MARCGRHVFCCWRRNRQLPAHGALFCRECAQPQRIPVSGSRTPLRIIDISVRSGGGAAQGRCDCVVRFGRGGGWAHHSVGGGFFPWDGFDAVFFGRWIYRLQWPVNLWATARQWLESGCADRGEEVFQRTLAGPFRRGGGGGEGGFDVAIRITLGRGCSSRRQRQRNAWWLFQAWGRCRRMGLAECVVCGGSIRRWAEAPHLRDGSREGNGGADFVVACHPA